VDENCAFAQKTITTNMEIQRNIHLNRLISRRHNGMIKVVTGMRHCGKSYLLLNCLTGTKGCDCG